MNAIRVHEFGPPEVMRLETLPDPVPGPGQVLVRVRAVGVNPVETYIRAGSYARRPSLPYTPGSDGAGDVVAVGEGVTRFRVGDRVYLHGSVTGTYAELALAEESHVHPLPEPITYAQGAALGIPYATAYRALIQRGGAIPGETVLVHGATGGVGIAAVQFAVNLGMTVIATGGTERGRELLRELGAHHVLDHHDPAHMEQAVALTGGHGVDVILEMLANVNLGRDLPALATGGRVVVIGSRGSVEINPRDTMARDVDIRGMVLFNASPRELASIHAAIGAGLVNGTLRPVIGRELPLAEAARAHHEIMEASHHGKIVLVP